MIDLIASAEGLRDGWRRRPNGDYGSFPGNPDETSHGVMVAIVCCCWSGILSPESPNSSLPEYRCQ